jgi:hypothetical protein
VFAFFLRNSLLFSLLLSLSLSSQTTTETRKHTTTTNSEEKHLFLQTIIEREKSLTKFSPFVCSEQKSQNKRKSAEKQPTPLMNTFALVFFHHVSSSLFTITHTRATKTQHKQE